jgi:hypothetical protein
MVKAIIETKINGKEKNIYQKSDYEKRKLKMIKMNLDVKFNNETIYTSEYGTNIPKQRNRK